MRTSVDFDYDEVEQPVELIEWTPERAAAIVRGAGYGLHTLDPISRQPGGERLWRATDADAQEIGAPLSRILNRYAPARRLAGHADEAELAIALMGYARRELAQRGRIVASLEQPEPEDVWVPHPPPAPQQMPSDWSPTAAPIADE